MPKRVQRKRTKGWKMPPNTVYVGRPSKWGNPFHIGRNYMMSPELERQKASEVVTAYQVLLNPISSVLPEHAAYKDWVLEHIGDLRGKDLACWCPPDMPCHADVLLELAKNA